jgi:hypothetical protein
VAGVIAIASLSLLHLQKDLIDTTKNMTSYDPYEEDKKYDSYDPPHKRDMSKSYDPKKTRQ